MDRRDRRGLLLEPVHALLGHHHRRAARRRDRARAAPWRRRSAAPAAPRRQVAQAVVAQADLAAGPHVLEALLVEHGARGPEQHEHHAEVHDVAAVALLVLAQQRGEGLEHVLLALAHAHADRARVLLDDRRRSRRRRGATPISSVERRARARPGTIASRPPATPAAAGSANWRRRLPGRGAAPGDQRAHAGEQQQQQRGHERHAVEELGADGDRALPISASEKTGKSVPQNTTISSAMKTQLLSRKLASRDTNDSMRCSLRSSLAPDQQRAEEDAGRDQHVAEEDGREQRRLREGVDRLHDAAARQEGAEEAERVGEADQQQVPGLQHVALFLDHHRVQVGGGRRARA